MSRVYALIKNKENVASVFYKSITHEKILAYTLDSNILFFSSLVEAKMSAQLSPQMTINFFNTLRGIDTIAIIELDTFDNEISEFTSIYQVMLDETPDGAFNTCWIKQDIYDNDTTTGALAEINRLYQEKKQYQLESILVV